MLAAINGSSAKGDINTLIADGCSCSSRASCILGGACERIHQSFAPISPGIA
jgi:hypothetical protein